ncbi:DNA-binding PadR family transcriptional regulator [Aeromicrobium panaciterrae]|uniref:DNA-binding PadR family transcriptional regulator n=1 Tax=Aeromicrobium panaciterrae TaxID=363861 RepID=A0ABU1UKA3_9ACTN|nr:PadR family transcriptional regulator [Aeromicrobium panaciterrae]MDR7085580.1 DNA-binding PadR family transcriptional regulator [Aeromicrobium panaciterrae]
MALEHAILVSLAEKTASGYDLARRFDASIGHFWKASHQQIYKVLGRMESDKWVESHLVAQDNRPDKKVYSITNEGRDELMRWSSVPTPIEPLRSEFAVKLRGTQFGDREAVLADVRVRRAAHEAQIAYYEASAQRHYPEPASLREDELGAYLVLRGGILAEQTGMAWCDEILQAFEAER